MVVNFVDEGRMYGSKSTWRMVATRPIRLRVVRNLEEGEIVTIPFGPSKWCNINHKARSIIDPLFGRVIDGTARQRLKYCCPCHKEIRMLQQISWKPPQYSHLSSIIRSYCVNAIKPICSSYNGSRIPPTIGGRIMIGGLFVYFSFLEMRKSKMRFGYLFWDDILTNRSIWLTKTDTKITFK